MAEVSMYSGRVVDGSLQTAVQEYRHPNGRSILMVGCVHVAEPDYYAEIRKIVDDAEASGATVLIESLKEGGDEDASEEELKAMRASRAALDTQYEDLPALLDLPWIYQGRSALASYPDTWQPSDARSLDIVRLIGPSNAVGLAPLAGKYEWYRQLKESKGKDSIRFIMARAKYAQDYILRFKQWGRTALFLSHIWLRIRGTIRRIGRIFSRKPASTGNGWMNPCVYTHRECVAALRALETKGDVVMLWNPGHMLGIGTILTRNRFEPQEPRHWLTACHKIERIPNNTSDTGSPSTGVSTGVSTGADKGFTRGDAE